MNTLLLIISAIAASVFFARGVGGFIINIVSDPKWHKHLSIAYIIWNSLLGLIFFIIFCHCLDLTHQ